MRFEVANCMPSNGMIAAANLLPGSLGDGHLPVERSAR
jgi:hypothetical protein